MKVSEKYIIEEYAKLKEKTFDEAREDLHAFEDIIKKATNQGLRVVWTGLATFVRKTLKARKGRNPKTSETIQLPEMDTIKVTASGTWKKEIR